MSPFKSTRLLLGLLLGFLGFQLLILPGRAHAINNNNNDIPTFIQNVYEPAGNVCQSPLSGTFRNYGQDAWLSPAGVPKTTVVNPSINVTYGVDTQLMWLNVLSTICNNNITKPLNTGTAINRYIKNTRNTNTGVIWTVDGGPAGGVTVSGLQGASVDLNYDKAYFFNNRYVVMDDTWFNTTPAHMQFTVSGLKSLSPGNHTIKIWASDRAIHKNDQGKFVCVVLNPDDSVKPARSLDDPDCGSTTPSFELNVFINRAPARGVLDQAVCTSAGLDLTGWAIDAKDLSYQSAIHVYADGALTIPVSTDSTLLANQKGTDLTDASTGIPGVNNSQNHRIYNSVYPPNAPSIPLSRLQALGLADGASHTVYAYAFDINGTAYALDNSGSVTFRCPPSPFTLVPTATCDASNNTITWSVTSQNGVNPGTVTVTRSYQINGNPATNIGNTSTAVPFSDTTGLPALNAGDTVTANITVNPGTGPNNPAPVSAATNGTPCAKKELRPYFQTWRSDILTGGRFAKWNQSIQRDEPTGPAGQKTCEMVNPRGGGISGFGKLGGGSPMSTTGGFAEYGIFAGGKIDFDGAKQNVPSQIFSQAFGQPYSSTGGKGYTFSNTGSELGRYKTNNCIHDYYGQFEAQAKQNPIPTSDFDLTPPGPLGPVKGFYYRQGDLHIKNTGSSLTNPSDKPWLEGVNATIVVDGDVIVDEPVYLTGNSGQLVDGSANLQTLLKNIPYLMVIAKGNIYFDHSINRADGTWIAQPTSDDPSTNAYKTTGIIDTCSNGGSTYTTLADIYDNCGGGVDPKEYRYKADASDPPGLPAYNLKSSQARITIKGGIYARKLLLHRLGGDIDTQQFNDTRNNTHAAERVKISPEIYFTIPLSGTDSRSDKYESVENLPPVL